MQNVIHDLWQSNFEISLLLLLVFAARHGIRHILNDKNTYLLWMSIPLGISTAWLISQIEFAKPPAVAVSKIVHDYVVQPYIVEPGQALDGWIVLAYLWLIAASALLIRLVYQHYQLRLELKLIRSANRLTSIPTSSSNYSRKNYAVVGVNKIDFSPAAYGFIKPKIYFPLHLQQELTPEQIGLIIAHEEQHIRYGHLWLNLLWDVAVCIFWFNPLLYLARKYFRHDQELYCDHLVLSKANTKAQRAYGHALISTASATHPHSLLCPWKSIHQLEERIMNIKKLNRVNNKTLLAIFSAAIVVCTSLYSVSAHETKSGSQPQKQLYKFVHQDDDNKHQPAEFIIMKDNKTFMEQNGEKFIMEGDVKREMTAEELTMYEQMVENTHMHELARKSMLAGESEKIHQQIKIITNHEGAELSEEEMEMLAHEMQNMQVEIEMHQDDFAMAQHEIDKARHDIEAAHEANHLSKTEAKKARRQLEKAAERLARDQQKLKESMEQARADIKRMRTDVLESRAY